MQVALKVVEGKQAGAMIPLTRKKFLIGREEDCQLRPNSDLVSRHHCVITIDDFSVRIRDLGSTNGTFVNDERITGQVMLNPGDQLRIGKLAFQVQIREDQPSPSSGLIEIPPEIAGDSPTKNDFGSETLTDFKIPAELLDQPTQSLAPVEVAPEPVAAPGYEQQPQYPPAYTPGYQMPGGFPAPGYQYPPSYPQPMGYPPMGYPAQPGYGMPYPQPGYPAPGYPPVGYPQSGYPQQMYPQGQFYSGDTSVMPPVAPATGAGDNNAASKDPLPLKLPDPSDTGVKAAAPAPVAAPTPPPAAGGEAPKPAAAGKPSTSAADIIKQYMQRRPGT